MKPSLNRICIVLRCCNQGFVLCASVNYGELLFLFFVVLQKFRELAVCSHDVNHNGSWNYARVNIDQSNLTGCVSRKWAGRDLACEQYKPEARKLPVKR